MSPELIHIQTPNRTRILHIVNLYIVYIFVKRIMLVEFSHTHSFALSAHTLYFPICQLPLPHRFVSFALLHMPLGLLCFPHSYARIHSVHFTHMNAHTRGERKIDRRTDKRSSSTSIHANTYHTYTIRHMSIMQLSWYKYVHIAQTHRCYAHRHIILTTFCPMYCKELQTRAFT